MGPIAINFTVSPPIDIFTLTIRIHTKILQVWVKCSMFNTIVTLYTLLITFICKYSDSQIICSFAHCQCMQVLNLLNAHINLLKLSDYLKSNKQKNVHLPFYH